MLKSRDKYNDKKETFLKNKVGIWSEMLKSDDFKDNMDFTIIVYKIID